MSFDRATGDLWVGDVGWELWELVYHVVRGGNYGWSLVEGPQSVREDVKVGPAQSSPANALPHSISASITGGYVYRGKRFPNSLATIFMAIGRHGEVGRHTWNRPGRCRGQPYGETEDRHDLTEPAVRLITFCEDNDGELYLVDYDLGTIHCLSGTTSRITPKRSRESLARLAYSNRLPICQPAPGVLPFWWSPSSGPPGAAAERLVAVPGAASITQFGQPVPTPGSMFERP